ncbi:MAG: CHASE2 domain-containing protein, partial [Spirochaetales bacterium]|nr:CHASE2 domain-containing protein [Spirochaetales bacterium]
IDLLIALKYYDVLPENIVIGWGSHITLTNALHPGTGERGDVVIPIDDAGNLRINYRAPHNTLPVRSFIDFNEQKIPLEYVTGKFLLIGITAAGGSHDFWGSPLGGMYGIEHHANILSMLFTRDFLYTFPFYLIITFILLFTFVTGIITYKQKFLMSSIFITFILILSFLGSIISFYYNIVFPFPYILFTVLDTFIIILIYKGFTGELKISGLFRDMQLQLDYNQQLSKDLSELMENTINATIEQVSDIDGYTGLHNEVVGMLGNEFQHCSNYIYFTKAEAKILCMARLHDIGKININPNILRKSDRLSGAEYEEIKWHTIAGERFLKRFNKRAFSDAAHLAFGHQESWDGVNGYPKGIPNALEDIEVREGDKIRWNFILDFMSVLDSFHAMTSNRPYRKGLSIEIVFRELVNNANTQFSTLSLEEFFSFFYTLYVKGIVRVASKNEEDLSLMHNYIYVNSDSIGNMDEFIQVHIRIMELFNSSHPVEDINLHSYYFHILRKRIKEYILIDNKNYSIQKIKNQLYTILIEKQEIKRIMTTYLDTRNRLRLLKKLETLQQQQEKLKEQLFEKQKYKQLFIKKIMIEYYDLFIPCPLGTKEFFYDTYCTNPNFSKHLAEWYNNSLYSLDFVFELQEDKLGMVRYNTMCGFLNSIGSTKNTPCYTGDILLYLYKDFNDEERKEYFDKINILGQFINTARFPDSTQIVHRCIAFLSAALKRKTDYNTGDLLSQWNSFFQVLKVYYENLILPIPPDLKNLLSSNRCPVQNYNIFTLVVELVGAYYIEKQAELEENWVFLFSILHKLNGLKTAVYTAVDAALTEKDLHLNLNKTDILSHDSFIEQTKKADFLTYLLQSEEEFLLEKINTSFFSMIIKFLRLEVWKQVKKIEEAYTVFKDIERKDYISDVKGSIIRMFKTGGETDDDLLTGRENRKKNIVVDGVDVFREAMDWVEETLKVMWI